MVNLPAREVWAGDIPALPLSVGRQDEGPFARADQYPYATHSDLRSSARVGKNTKYRPACRCTTRMGCGREAGGRTMGADEQHRSVRRRNAAAPHLGERAGGEEVAL